MNRTFIGVIGAAVLGALTACSGQGDEWSQEIDTRGDNLTAKTVSPYVTQFAASCVIDGKMLVAGGYDTVGSAISTVYLFDPSGGGGSGSWTQKEDLPAARGEASMIALPDTDKCLFVGGKTTQGNATSENESYIYDLSADTTMVSNDGWTAISGTAMSADRAAFPLSICGDPSNGTKIIAVAGEDGNAALDTIELFDLATQSWSALTTLSSVRSHVALAPFVSDPGSASQFQQFLIAGGNSGASISSSLDLLTFSSSTCSTANDTRVLGDDPLSTARTQAFAFPDGSGNSFQVCGGLTASGYASSCEKITVASFGSNGITVAAGATMNEPRARGHVVKLLEDASELLILGGRGGAGILAGDTVATGQIWDTTQQRFEDVSGNTANPFFSMTSRVGGAVEYLADDNVAAAVGVGINAGVVSFRTAAEILP